MPDVVAEEASSNTPLFATREDATAAAAARIQEGQDCIISIVRGAALERQQRWRTPTFASRSFIFFFLLKNSRARKRKSTNRKEA